MIVGASAGPLAMELLVVGQGIDPAWDVSRLIMELRSTLEGHFARVPLSIFVEQADQALGLVAAPPSITVDRNKLKQYLAGAKLPVPNLDKPLERWAPDGSAGGHDALVVLLLGAAAQASVAKADALSLDRSDGLPPVVAIQLGAEPLGFAPGFPYVYWEFGHLWHQPVARAVAQLRFSLLDEHELPGSDFTRPPADWVAGFNNVVFLSATQRAALQGAVAPKTRALLGDAVSHWPLDDGHALAFTPHAGPDTQVSIAGPLAGAGNPGPAETLALYEGAAGYRTFAVRGAADCLMRRMPASKDLPIQDEVGFCPVCRHLIAGAIEQGEARRLTRPTLISTQKLEFERLSWPVAPQRLTGPAVKGFSVTEAAAAGLPPHWGATVRVAAPSGPGGLAGLVAEDVTLTDRPDDPFVNSPKVFKRIWFDVSITFDGQTTPQALSVGDALNATGDLAPELLVQRDAGSFQAQLGYRLTLRWELANGWRVEAAMSLVLKRAAATIDPGSAVVGCKALPQLKLRVLRAPGHTGQLPGVTSLNGTVHMRLDNVIEAADEMAMMDAGMDAPSGAKMTDALEAVLFTDGNDVHGDAIYADVVAAPATPVFALPDDVLRLFPTESLQWIAFRRLAGVQSFPFTAPLAVPVAGAITRGYTRHASGAGPILPLWSMLFDYLDPDCAFQTGVTTTFTGVWPIGTPTPAGRAASAPAEVVIDWPPPESFPDLAGKQPALRHRRLPRQGTWDNIHATPPMGIDREGRETISAPVCADKCFHLHWRWGSDGIKAPADKVKEPERYMGWEHVGPWRANRRLGAPLIPPNQKLEFAVTRIAGDQIDLAYAIQAGDPQPGHWQVVLEQGTGFAFNYQGLPSFDYLLLANVLGEFPTAADDPASRRKLFITKIYPRLRWFATPDDGTTTGTVQQIPSRTDLSPAKWQELRDA